MKQTPTKRKIRIEIEFEETKDVKFLLANLSKQALEMEMYETKHLSAVLSLSGIKLLPFQEPREETINGRNCMVFKSIM
jgi:hypothetical protein